MGARFRIKKLLPRTLFWRSLLIIVTPVLLAQMISTFIFIDRHWSKVTDRLAFAVAGETAVIAESIEGDSESENIARIAGYAARNLDLLVSYEPDEILVPDVSAPLGWRSLVADGLVGALDKQVRRPFALSVDPEEKWVDIRIQLKGGVLTVSTLERRLFTSSAYIFLLWMIFSSAILFAVAILFMRNQIRPIRRLAIAAECFGKGRDVPASFKPEGASEIRQAARAFLEMHERIKRQIAQRTTMLAGISHDLRTPLTRLRLQLAMMDETPDVSAMKDDIAEMERMVNAYLDFVRGEGDEVAEPVDLSALIEQVISALRRQDGGRTIFLDLSGDLRISVRPVAFSRVLGNLVSNSAAYGRNIWISARRLGDQVEIRVEDDGPGIPEALREEVFKPFFRGDASRHVGGEGGGVGLGLSIARDIVHAHGGSLVFEAGSHGGACAVVVVPV